MVDISHKAATRRRAVAQGGVVMQAATLRAITEGRLPKGEALPAARIAGILAAKQTDRLIPLCHGLPLDSIPLEFVIPAAIGRGDDTVTLGILASAVTTARTGVEMEALTAVSLAALTIYDMTKAVDQTLQITQIRLVSKTGGKSNFDWPADFGPRKTPDARPAVSLRRKKSTGSRVG